MKQDERVQVDDSEIHPTVVFFQDVRTKYTAAMDATTGKLIRTVAPKGLPAIPSDDVLYPMAEAWVKWRQGAGIKCNDV